MRNSIYQLGWEAVEHVGGGSGSGARKQPTFLSAQAPVTEPAVSPYAHLRRANPVDKVLPIAAKWLESLPTDVRPQSLAQQFPRLVNVIALEWRDTKAAGRLLSELLSDSRIGRRGFPPLVHNELLALLGLAYLRLAPRN